MLRMFIILLGFSVFSLSATERVKWEQGKEISVELKTDVERKVGFPEPVRFGYKARYAQLFKQSIIDNVFYITAVQEFNEKLTFQGLDSGRFYVLQASVSDISTKAGDELVIQLQADSNAGDKAESGQTGSGVIPGSSAVPLTPIDLVQYASQSLYAPSESLVEAKPGIRRIALKQREVPHLYRGGAFKATTLASWSGSGMYVTAVKLANTTPAPVDFEPCRIRGDFYSATAQFKTAFRSGNSKDFTVIYLVSEKPFDVAVQGMELLCV